MLGGIDPIVIFQFSKKLPELSELIAKIPVVSQIPTVLDAPPIPIYLSERLTGIYIDSEDKNVDIATETETLSDGATPDVNQKGIASVVSINIVGKKDSIGLTLLSAMIDLLFDKVTSKEYAITYLHGATTVFRGVLHSYSVNQNAGDDRLLIKIELSKGSKTPVKPESVPVVGGIVGTLPL